MSEETPSAYILGLVLGGLNSGPLGVELIGGYTHNGSEPVATGTIRTPFGQFVIEVRPSVPVGEIDGD